MAVFNNSNIPDFRARVGKQRQTTDLSTGLRAKPTDSTSPNTAATMPDIRGENSIAKWKPRYVATPEIIWVNYYSNIIENVPKNKTPIVFVQ